MQAFVKVGDAEAGVLDVTLKDPADNPYARLKPELPHDGSIEGWVERGAIVRLDGGATGFLPHREAGLARDVAGPDALPAGTPAPSASSMSPPQTSARSYRAG